MRAPFGYQYANSRNRSLWPGGHVKSHLLVGLVAGIAVCASSVSAQVCQGDLSFRNRSKHIGGAIGLGENSTTFGAGLTVGHAQGWFGGASVGMQDYDGVDGNAAVV